MADHDIRKDMQVIASDGGLVGEVDGVEPTSIKLKRAQAGGGAHHFVPLEWVDRVDDHVHLSVPAATVRDRWTSDAGTGAYAAGPAVADERKTNWIPWLIGLILLALVLFLGLKGCNYAAKEPVYDNQTATVDNGAATAAAPTAPLPLSEAETYLAGTDATPQTFAFEKLNFDTSSAAIRDADKDEVARLAALLKQYPTAKIRVVGYADARGSDPANATLGQRRADAVKASLVSQGVDTDRVETATGGEEAPAATNATAQGQFENRRTEFVVVSR